jgi:DNA-binding transcriptional ArsR family regulator
MDGRARRGDPPMPLGVSAARWPAGRPLPPAHLSANGIHCYMLTSAYMGTSATSPSSASVNALNAASELLRALASPVRLGIVRELAAGGREVHELVTALGVSQPLVSQHLRVLRTSRLVIAHRHARSVEYSLADDHVAHIVLDALRHVEEGPGRTPGTSA